jgi:hypothetical protein
VPAGLGPCMLAWCVLAMGGLLGFWAVLGLLIVHARWGVPSCMLKPLAVFSVM